MGSLSQNKINLITIAHKQIIIRNKSKWAILHIQLTHNRTIDILEIHSSQILNINEWLKVALKKSTNIDL